jgi:hypothetical protein
MNDLRKAAQQMVAAMESYPNSMVESPENHWHYTRDLALDALRAALAQPEPEPVAWRYDEATYRPDDLRGRQWHFTLFSTRKPYADEMVQNVTPLYTAPPQRKPLRYVTYVCPVCAASLERQE